MNNPTDRIIEARKAKSLTQSEVADAIGMKLKTYSYKESNGKFSPEELRKVLEFLGVPTEEPIKSPGNDYQGKYIGVLEQLLNQDLKDVKVRIEGLEQKLNKLVDSFGSAEMRQKAAFVIVQYMSEELAAVPKDEKNRKRLVDNSRKEIVQRLEAGASVGK